MRQKLIGGMVLTKSKEDVVKKRVSDIYMTDALLEGTEKEEEEGKREVMLEALMDCMH